MTIAKADIDRFKKAFKGTVAAKDTPLLAHKVALPPSVTGSDRLKKALEALEGKLSTMSADATAKRTGKKMFGSSWTKDSTSSLKQTADALDDEDVDLDALSNITRGKGQAEAQAALNELKNAEKLIQATVVDELIDQVATDTDPKGAATRTDELLAFLSQPGVQVTGAHDKAVLGVAKILAGCLNVTIDWLKKSTPDDLRAVYLDKLYGKLKMDTAASRDPGVMGPLYDALRKLQVVDASLLTPDSDAAILFNTFTAAKIGDNASLNQARAGKYSTGQQEARKAKYPSASADGKGCEVSFEGNKRFVDGVASALGDIAKTPAGKALLDALAKTGKPLKIQAPAISNAKSVGPDGSLVFGNSAGNGVVSVDPENNVAIDGADSGKAATELWRQREASVALYHEMIHALIAKQGGETWKSPDAEDASVSFSDVGDITELRIVGIDYVMDHKGKKVRFPFSDPKYNPITENEYRRALARSKGQKDVYLRPSYANVAGQVPLSTDKVRV
jgi:hypothetical protein